MLPQIANRLRESSQWIPRNLELVGDDGKRAPLAAAASMNANRLFAKIRQQQRSAPLSQSIRPGGEKSSQGLEFLSFFLVVIAESDSQS